MSKGRCNCVVKDIKKMPRNQISCSYIECEYCKKLKREFQEEYHKKIKEKEDELEG